eukprot:364653-Chlamydomonas_euryale.AAC.14
MVRGIQGVVRCRGSGRDPPDSPLAAPSLCPWPFDCRSLLPSRPTAPSQAPSMYTSIHVNQHPCKPASSLHLCWPSLTNSMQRHSQTQCHTIAHLHIGHPHQYPPSSCQGSNAAPPHLRPCNASFPFPCPPNSSSPAPALYERRLPRPYAFQTPASSISPLPTPASPNPRPPNATPHMVNAPSRAV